MFERLLPGMPILLLQAVVPRGPGTELIVLCVMLGLGSTEQPLGWAESQRSGF